MKRLLTPTALAAMAVVVVSASPVLAQGDTRFSRYWNNPTTQNLLNLCDSEDVGDLGMCMGAIAGTFNMAHSLNLGGGEYTQLVDELSVKMLLTTWKRYAEQDLDYFGKSNLPLPASATMLNAWMKYGLIRFVPDKK